MIWIWRFYRLRRTIRTLRAIRSGNLKGLLRRWMIGRLLWVPLYRHLFKKSRVGRPQLRTLI